MTNEHLHLADNIPPEIPCTYQPWDIDLLSREQLIIQVIHQQWWDSVKAELDEQAAG